MVDMALDAWHWVAAACIWLVSSGVVAVVLGRALRRREDVDAHIRQHRFGSPRDDDEGLRH